VIGVAALIVFPIAENQLVVAGINQFGLCPCFFSAAQRDCQRHARVASFPNAATNACDAQRLRLLRHNRSSKSRKNRISTVEIVTYPGSPEANPTGILHILLD